MDDLKAIWRALPRKAKAIVGGLILLLAAWALLF